MRKWKIFSKIFSITLVFFTIGSMFIWLPNISSAEASSSYDREAAYNYAQKYWNKVCSDGYFFEQSYPPSYIGAGKTVPAECGCDCAHFVSCCIGSEPHEQGGGLNIPSRTEAYGEPGAQRLADWLTETSGFAEEKNSIDEMMMGDVIVYRKYYDQVWHYHAVLYLGNGKIAAHSVSYWEEAWDIYFDAGFVVYKRIHINGPLYSEKNPVSVTDSLPYFNKGSNTGHPESWHSYTHDGHTYIYTYVGGLYYGPDNPRNDPNKPDCWAEFRPYLSQSGKYEVYACFYADPQNSHQVLHTVYYNGGSTTVEVDQYASNYFTWREVKLGTWDFAAGADTRVVVTDATGEPYDGTTTLNVDTIEFMLISPINNPPNQPTSLSQLRSDGINVIPEGGITDESTVVFKGTVSDPDGDQVRLEIELRQISEAFTGEPTSETISSFVDSGTQVAITRYGLVNADYHWQYRAKDSNGATSSWVEFGAPANIDFTVSLNAPPQLSDGAVEPTSGNTSTDFYYYVTYFDPDGDEPSVRQVYIDGIAYTMNWHSGLDSLITYRYGPKNLPAGSHTYYFYFEDGRGGTARLPTSGSRSGPTVTIPGDINGDGKVDHKDLLLLANAYGLELGDPNYIPEADINCSGKIDHKDLLILASNYGKGT